MCGIAGIVDFKGAIEGESLHRMANVLHHRGPNSGGIWISPERNVGLASRRLAILDLSADGNQPMRSVDGRYCLIYNGELYNYRELRSQHVRQGIQYRGNSDTEVLLNHFALKQEQCLEDFDGMFAFAIWDSALRRLFCARDRFGEKPFFYSLTESRFVFGSEIKAVHAAGVSRAINHKMLQSYLQNPAHPRITGQPEATFFSEVRKLCSGSWLTIDQSGKVSSRRYWQVTTAPASPAPSFEEAKEHFQALFRESVKRRLRSDVPLGSSLSGGVDSSSIVATVAESGDLRGYSTFSARFPGFEKDEGAYIDEVNRKVGAIPKSVSPTADDLAQQIDEFCYYHDEPVESASAFAQWSVMRLVQRENVTVLLDGQGGDEIAAGYYDYFAPFLQELGRADANLAAAERVALEQVRGVALPSNGRKEVSTVARLRARMLRSARRGFARMPAFQGSRGDTFLSRSYMWEFGQDAELAGPAPATLNEALAGDLVDGKFEHYLRYADRNSMAHSVEVRLPFLSHELVEFMFSLPAVYKIHDGWTKYVVRKAMAGKVPDAVLWRTEKVGFAAPQDAWLGSPSMRALADDSYHELVSAGIVNRSWIRTDLHDWQMIMAASLLKGHSPPLPKSSFGNNDTRSQDGILSGSETRG